LHTDASIDGYGAVLIQRSPDDNLLHPVYYMSRKTKKEERNYTSYELEVLAIIETLKKFRIYLLGIRFKIVTDCAAFQRIMHNKEWTGRIARWALLIEDYDYSIEHKTGTHMRHVDALSRYSVTTILKGLVIPQITTENQQKKDNEIRALLEVAKGKPYDNYHVNGGLLYKFQDGRDLLVIPRALETNVIRTIHEKGHISAKRTEELIRQEYFIRGLKNKVE